MTCERRGTAATIAGVLNDPEQMRRMLDDNPPATRNAVAGWAPVAVAMLMVAGLHFAWGGLYVFHATVNQALPMWLWSLLAGAGLPFLGLAGLARVSPRAAGLLGIMTLFGVHFAIAVRLGDWTTLFKGLPIKAIMLIIVVRALMMSMGTRRR